MSFASIQNGVQSVVPVGGWREGSECFAPCNSSFATIDERQDFGTIQHGGCVEPAASVRPGTQDHAGVRPFWQYLADSNSRDRLERAARPSQAASGERALDEACRARPRETSKLAAVVPVSLPVSAASRHAKAAYVECSARENMNRIIDVVA
jgi:hypothetical protein